MITIRRVAVAAVLAGAVSVAAEKSGEEDAKVSIRVVKDLAGREWQLEDWKDGMRPYARDLAERERKYRAKWGEDWCGPEFKGSGGYRYIASPGTWKHEDFVVIKDGKRACVRVVISNHQYANSQPLPYAPGAGDVVTDV